MLFSLTEWQMDVMIFTKDIRREGGSFQADFYPLESLTVRGFKCAFNFPLTKTWDLIHTMCEKSPRLVCKEGTEEED